MVSDNLEKTEKFILELIYNDEICDIDAILERIINTASVGKGIRQIVNEAKIYNKNDKSRRWRLERIE